MRIDAQSAHQGTGIAGRGFRELSPGWVLLGNLLQWANENKRTSFDFMRGDEDYKYRFGGISRHVVRSQVEKSLSKG